MKNNSHIRCVINQLGPIRNSEIAFSPLMVFTGRSGVGKSYTAFLMYYFISFFTGKGLSDFCKARLNEDWTPEKDLKFSFTIGEMRQYINRNAGHFIGYLIGDTSFTCDVDFILNADEEQVIEVETTLQEEKEDGPLKGMSLFHVKINGVGYSFLLPSGLDAISWALQLYFLNNVMSDMQKVHKTILLPPARAALMGANYTTQNMVASVGMYNEFIKDFDYINRARQRDTHPFFESSISNLLNGKLVSEKGELFLQLATGKRLPISAAASSVKELAPLLLLLQADSPEGISVLFEEPEAHSHPTMQTQVMDLIARCINRGACFQITTHSDYLLNRMNQLIRMGMLKEKSEELFAEFCAEHQQDESLYLLPSQVASYYFEEQPDGHVDIIRQGMEDGVEFTTFRSAVDEQFKMDVIIDDYLNR